MIEGVENEENATFALLMHAYDKALPPPPFLPLPLLPSFRFLINTEKDRINIQFSIVDQRIKFIYRARCVYCTDRKHPWQKRGVSCLIAFTLIRSHPIASNSHRLVINRS